MIGDNFLSQAEEWTRGRGTVSEEGLKNIPRAFYSGVGLPRVSHPLPDKSMQSAATNSFINPSFSNWTTTL